MTGEPDLDRVIHGTLFGEAVNAAAVPALLAAEDGAYIAANDAVCDLTGYTRKELTEFRVGDLAADEASRGIYSALSRGMNLRGRKSVRRANGTIVPCDYWAIATRVTLLPYVILFLWPAEAA